jgi:alpha-beta hydrolase superfamily lysophospholipase
MLAWLLGVLVILFALSIARSRRAALRLRDDAARRVHFEPSGIITGANEIDLRHGPSRHAVLLLHGGGDTPQTLRYLAEYL